MTETLLFKFGTEGGGAAVFRLPTKAVVEKGSSGGILDDEEDPLNIWEDKYESWEDWWQNFTEVHKENWIRFYPQYIHADVKEFIKSKIKNCNYVNEDLDHYKQSWLIMI